MYENKEKEAMITKTVSFTGKKKNTAEEDENQSISLDFFYLTSPRSHLINFLLVNHVKYYVVFAVLFFSLITVV